tara:strand:- start:73 stop:246 length:174 start_codon:yes stop_codon:yes gene_type:complete
MIIQSAQYIKDIATNETDTIKVVDNGIIRFVPIDTNNKDYDQIQKWIEDGNSVEEAD